jgi:hypothetical protein
VRFPAELVVTIPRRWTWALGIGVALLGGMLLWLVLAARAAAPSVASTVQSAVAAAERRVMGPVPLRPATPMARTPERESAHGVDEYEVCGGAWVKVNAEGEPDEAAMTRAMRRDDVIRAVDGKLAADSRPQAQAARLWLQMVGSDDHRRALAASTLACGGETCPPELAGSAPAIDAVAMTRNSLARLAIGANDPATYALAFHACGSGRMREGSCALLSAEQWARLDPGNAAPWQEVFAAAQQRKDTASANEALHRIATSKRSDQRTFDLLSLILEAAPEDDELQSGVFVLSAEVVGVQAAWTLPAYQPLVAACKPEMLRDSNRRQTCEAIGELFAQRSDSMLERGIGASLGRQLGWPDERIDRLRAEQTAYVNSMFTDIDPRQAMSCTSIRRSNDQFRRTARLGGEVGAMRDWLAREAPPPDELLRRYRAQRELGKALAAVQAASAASAPG